MARTDQLNENYKLYTITEAMEVLGLSRRSVMTYIYSGKLPANKVGGKWRITEATLKAFATPNSTADIISQAGELTPEQKERLLTFIDELKSE